MLLAPPKYDLAAAGVWAAFAVPEGCVLALRRWDCERCSSPILVRTVPPRSLPVGGLLPGGGGDVHPAATASTHEGVEMDLKLPALSTGLGERAAAATVRPLRPPAWTRR